MNNKFVRAALLFVAVFVPGLALCADAQTPVTFPGTTAVGQSSAAITVTVTMTGTGIAAAPQAETQGNTTGTDFALANGGTCAANTVYSVGQQCTANVTFAPTYPGVRAGAVVVLSAGGGLLGEALLQGTATGPMPVLSPALINTVAGDGQWIYKQDGVPATSAPIFLPMGVVTDAAGNLYLSDSNNNRVRRVDAKSGLISTIAGTGTPGYSGDNGLASAAQVSQPAGIAMDGAGNLYFADNGNHAIRRIDGVTGIITTVAGTPTVQGYTGDGGAAISATLNAPEGVSLDAAGNIIIADTGNNAVRKVTVATGKISTLAGPAVPASMRAPWSMAIGPDGTIYVADVGDNVVKTINAAGIVTVVAGTGMPGYTGDGGPATAATLSGPAAVAVDPAGDLFIADSGDNAIREVTVSNGTIQTIAGTGGEEFAGDGGPDNKAGIYGPYALYLDGMGNLFVADMFHNRVREIYAQQLPLIYATIRVGKTSAPVPVGLENEGNSNLTVSSFTMVNSALDPATTTCNVGAAQNAGVACNLGVEFAPKVTGTPVTGTLTVVSNAANVQPVINLTGNVLSVNPTSIGLTSNVNPSLVGSAVTFTASVSGGGGGALTGTVIFYDGTTQLCSVALAANMASCATSNLALGSHNITADYGGDPEDAAANSSVLVQVVQQQPTLALVVNPNPTAVGTSVTLTLTATAPTGTPTGTIEFYDGTIPIGAASLSSSGVATFSTSALAPGSHSLSGQYSGDAINASGTSNVVNEVINQATTTTTLSSSAGTVVVGTNITFTANVTGTSTNSNDAPTGTVQFLDGGALLGSGTLNASGVATLTTSALTPGTHKIVATYVGDTNNAGSSSVALVEIVNQIGTTTTLAVDSNPANAGQTIHFTATVTLAGGAAADGPITGTVTFTDGGTTIGTAAVNASGQAVLAISTLSAGTHAIIATYAGNTNYSGSSSGALGEVIQTTGTTTTLGESATTINAGQPVTFTATVTSATGVPTGNVTFRTASLTLGQGTLNAQGIATFTTTTLPVGTYVVSAVYAGDGNYLTSTSGTVTLVVQQAPTTTTLATSANPSVVGQPLTLTASVVSAGANLTGSIAFMDGSTVLSTVPLGTNGTATYTTSSLAFGSHTLTAVYSGDADHATSTSLAVNEQIVQAASASLTSSANPATSGVNVTFTATLAGVNGITPTGSVVFHDGANTLGTSTLVNGVATFQTSTLTVGTHTITVTYSGDTNYSTATAMLTETIQNANTQIALTASANPATYGTPLSLVAVVTSNGGTATGTIVFTDGGTTIGSATLDATGTATLSLSTLLPGTHSIVANYAGDGRASASVSTPLAVVVKELTQTALTSSANPAQTLTAITLTATVTNAGVGVATGSVTFTDGSSLLGTVALNASGVATLNVPSLTAGTHSIVAAYAGDATDFASVSGTLSQAVNLRPTTTSLTATPTDPNNPQQVTMIAVVSGNGTPPPSGTVTFTMGSQVLGTATLGPTGVATLAIVLQQMTEMIVATYNGDASYATSASPATAITGGTATQFTLQLTPSSATIASKQRTTVNVTMVSLNSFTDTMNLGCLGLPFAATCTFSSDQAKLPGNGTATVQLTIDTGNPLGAGSQASNHVPSYGMSPSSIAVCLLPLGALLGFGLRRRRKLLGLLAVLLVAAMTLTASGCASGLSINGTPAGTYKFTVGATGQGTSASESQTFTLTVTQ